MCNPRDGTTGQTVQYTQDQIRESLDIGWDYIRRQVSRNQLGQGWGGRVYPHRFGGVDIDLRGADPGDGNWDDAYVFPLQRRWNTPGGNDAIAGNGDHHSQGPDREVFDGQGRYLGVMTHRGHTDNSFQ